MKSRAVLALAFLSFLLAPAAFAGEEIFRPKLETADLPEAGSEWYGVYVHGQKAGWGCLGITREGEGENARYVYEGRFLAKLTGLGSRMDLTFEERKEFSATPPFRLLSARNRQSMNGQVRTVESTMTAEGVKATVVEDGMETALERPPVDHRLGDELAMRIYLLRHEVKKGTTIS